MVPSSSLLLIPVAGISTGILLSSFGAGFLWGGIIILVSISVYLLVHILSKNPSIAFKINRLHYVWIFILFSGIGIISFEATKPTDISDSFSELRYARGIIKRTTATNFGDKAVINVTAFYNSEGISTCTNNIDILIRTDALNSGIDDEIIFPVRLKRIADSQETFYEGYAKQLNNKGIYYESRCQPEDITSLGQKRSFSGIAWIIRTKLESFIEKSGLSTQTGHFLITVLLGDRDFLHDSNRKLFADAGISHILALSGMHVGIIAAVLLWILLPFNLTRSYKLRLIITVLILFFYAFITGWSATTLRAVLMLTSVSLCLIIERKNNSWNALLFATLIILLITPGALFDAGFQLSFVCVGALLFFTDKINPIDHHSHPILYRITALFLTTIVAVAATWCISSYYFNSLPVVFLPANILILPILPFYLTASIIYLLLTASGIHLPLFASILDSLFNCSINIINWLSAAASSAISIEIPAVSVFVWIITIVTLAYFVNSGYKRIWGYCTCISLLIFISTFILMTEASKPDALIVRSAPDCIHLSVRKDDKEYEIRNQRHANSEFILNDEYFLLLDGPVESFYRYSKKRYKAVIIGGSMTSEIRNILTRLESPEIITHPSLRKKRESEILKVADSLGLHCHSIRHDGAWRYIQEK